MMRREEIDRLGGPTEVANACGLTKSAVSMWFKNGTIPYRHAKKIKELATKIGLDWDIDYIMEIQNENRRDNTTNA